MVHPAAQFNSNLYVVGATVLPVLFITLMLEGGGLARTAIWAAKLQLHEFRRLKALAQAEAAKLKEQRGIVIAVSDPYGLLVLPAVGCMVLFGLGVVSAVLAINARHATAFEHLCVVAALVSLPIVLVLVTAGSIVTTGSRELKRPETGRRRGLAADVTHQALHPRGSLRRAQIQP